MKNERKQNISKYNLKCEVIDLFKYSTIFKKIINLKNDLINRFKISKYL